VKHYPIPLLLGLALSCAFVASASARGHGGDMPLGPGTLPPAGYIAFCMQRPEQCGSPGDPFNLQAVQQYWSMAFELSPSNAQALPSNATTSRNRIALTEALNVNLVRVNRQVNQLIRSVPDKISAEGGDLWSLPLADGRREGDCEDFVLEKRRALIAAGVPYDALSIAVVRTAFGKAHAVLIVGTDSGELVLDSRSPWVLSWDDIDYAWVKRQSPINSRQWIALSKPSHRGFR
jgi:predicted transglutaminase-like cysteine proteinase